MLHAVISFLLIAISLIFGHVYANIFALILTTMILYKNKSTWKQYCFSIFWFVFYYIHGFLHSTSCRITIVESNRATLDEVWHLFNALVWYLMIRKKGIDDIQWIVYYVILLCGFWMNFEYFNIFLYYYGATQTFLFNYSYTKNQTNVKKEHVLVLPLHFQIFIHSLNAYIITFPNAVGNLLLDSNIAGCAFLSEYIMLTYFMNDSQAKRVEYDN